MESQLTSNRVFVLDRRKRPLMPCSPKRARLLLERGRARVHRLIPFTIRLVDRTQEDSELQPIQVKIDPGSKVSGMAVVRQDLRDSLAITPLWLMELTHRGQQIRTKLQQRAMNRKNRRGRKTRYRPSRFQNRTRPQGWLPPSLNHRIDSTLSWVNRLRRRSPVTSIVVERVRFDTQQLQNPEISGVEHQQGTLLNYEVREYLLEKWNRTCVYCDGRDRFLQMDHIVPRSRGGSNRVSNLTLACPGCNLKKGSQYIEDFLSKDPKRLARILAHCKRSLRDAAAMNATRNCLYRELIGTGLPVGTGTGGQTKWNRSRFGIPKTHAHDALCVGEVSSVTYWRILPIQVKAVGRGRYQRTLTDRFGFPRLYLGKTKTVFGYRTHDVVCRQGTYHTATIRQNGQFVLRSLNGGLLRSRSYRTLTPSQRADGYTYIRTPSLEA